jgi:hypothetical protein
MSFIGKYRLICSNQFGFRAGTNTSDALIEFLDFAYSTVELGQYLLAVFLDFSKAFDTVNLDILLRKLEHMGFRGLSNRWFESYLRGRTQYVGVGGDESSVSDVSIGVPQDSRWVQCCLSFI